MITRLFLCATWFACLLLPGPAAAGPAPAVEAPPADAVVWTTWGASQYSLADDGDSLWIGATGSVVRWDKQGQTYRRYAAPEGLPHTAVRAVAVDPAGNRWFGGDHGLSRLDPAERWMHFTTANSGIYTDTVDGIAVGGGGALFVSHGLPAGPISRLTPDGAWERYPNRETAITANYAAIWQGTGRSALWTVAGDEIWAGYWAYDGVRWHDRTPPYSAAQPIALAADSRDHLWVLADGWHVWEWDGAGWSGWLWTDVGIRETGRMTALAVAPDDTVWIGLRQYGPMPFSYETAYIRPLFAHDPSAGDLGVSGSVADLLFTPEGLWGIGPGWLATPGRAVVLLRDGPRFTNLPDVLADAEGGIWLSSGYGARQLGAVQIFDDNDTAALHDDRWQTPPQEPVGAPGWVTAWERSPNGDVWYTGYSWGRVPLPTSIVRYHGQEGIGYPPQYVEIIRDIFVQDDRHIWLAADGLVAALDDGGTPADSSDDVWQSWTLPVAGTQATVAVDAGGRAWYGNAAGLYRYDGSAWLPVYTERGICDLTPAADVLYAQVTGSSSTNCQPYAGPVLAVRSGGVDAPTSIEALLAGEPASVRTASRRNTLWAIAPDGAIWTIHGNELRRQDGPDRRTYTLPFDASAVRRLEVDAANRAWLVANDQLWRMSRPVDFALDVQPQVWLLAPGRSREGQVHVLSLEGYTGSVSLSVVDPPAGIAARFASDVVAAGQATGLALEAAPDSAPAVQRLVIRASDDVVTHTVALTVTVAATLYETHLPAIFR